MVAVQVQLTVKSHVCRIAILTAVIKVALSSPAFHSWLTHAAVLCLLSSLHTRIWKGTTAQRVSVAGVNVCIQVVRIYCW